MMTSMPETTVDVVSLIRNGDFARLCDWFLRISIWSAFSNGPHWLLVAVTVAFSLVGVVLWGSFVGSILPFILRRLGFDPATSSAPFVATLVDVTGLVKSLRLLIWGVALWVG
jgi:magnesium transporter